MSNIARFTAHFDSKCHDCGDAIDEGDEMGYDKDQDEYICMECVELRS